MDYTQELKRDVIEWDIVNWWKFIEFIDQSGIGFEGKKILDIGGRNGGLSLYFLVFLQIVPKNHKMP